MGKFKKNLTSGLGGDGDNEIVSVFSNGQLAILKMAAVQPHLLMDQNHFKEQTHLGIEKISTKFLKWFQRRCHNRENQRWLPVAIFVNGQEPFYGVHN